MTRMAWPCCRPSNGSPTPTGTTSYSYDELDRLLSVSSPGSGGANVVGCRYDLDGNRRTPTYPDQTCVTATYDKADRITSVGGSGCTVDADGNPVSGCAFSNAYDAANRLTGASGVVSTSYTLDGDGKRTYVDVAGNPNSHHFDYVYDVDGALPAVLVDGNSNGSLKYVWGPAGLAYAVDTSNGVTVYHMKVFCAIFDCDEGGGGGGHFITTERRLVCSMLTVRSSMFARSPTTPLDPPAPPRLPGGGRYRQGSRYA